MATNVLPFKNVYPASGRMSLGGYATGYDVAATQAEDIQQSAGAVDVDAALNVGGQASPLLGLAVFAGLSLAVMLIAQNYGEAGEFSNLRASAYNILIISLIAVAGIPVWKFLFTRLKVPGVSSWVLSV